MQSRKKITILAGLVLAGVLLGSTSSFAKTGIVNTDTLRLRKEASTEATTIELLNLNEELEIVGEEGDWYQVTYKGITGYVSKQYIKVEEEQTNTDTQNQTSNETTNTQIDTTTTPEESSNAEEGQVEEKVIKEDTKVSILPLLQANKIDELKAGTKITVVTKTNGWCYIATPELNGWIREEKIAEKEEQTLTTNANVQEEEEESETQTTDWQETAMEETTMYVKEASVYVRKGPGTDYEILTSLIKNDEVTVVAQTGEWYKIEVNGQTGFIANWLVATTKQEVTSRGEVNREAKQDVSVEEDTQVEQAEITSTTKGQQIVDYAKQYLGCPYVYGGSGPSTFDCSGFTMYVYRNFGITLSHSAIAQSKNGVYVAKEDLQPGDMVFFKDYETMEGIGHCGIYIGDGEFIHASSGTGYCVKTSTLLSGSYATRYETARRLI